MWRWRALVGRVKDRGKDEETRCYPHRNEGQRKGQRKLIRKEGTEQKDGKRSGAGVLEENGRKTKRGPE